MVLNTQSYMWDWIGYLLGPTLRAPYGANNEMMTSPRGLMLSRKSAWYLHLQNKKCCIGYILVFLRIYVQLFSTVCFKMFLQIACLRWCIITLVAFVWLFSTVCFQMSPQMACPRGCIITLVAFVWLFSTVSFKMCPQIACIRGYIVALVAFVWHFSIVCSQMYP